MSRERAFHEVFDELARPAARHEPDWDDVERRATSHGRSRPSGRRRRTLIAAALAGLTVVGAGVALAAASDILDGPAAEPERDAALRSLFPPLGIGPATKLVSRDGRTLYGARTKRGSYCFSATSPSDPNDAGGHCVSDAEARRLDQRGVVAVAMSGSSIGGYAPGARYVRVTGATLDLEIPVSDGGWWVGVAELPSPPLPTAVDEATVVATAYTLDGDVIGSDPLIRIRRVGGDYPVSFVFAFV